MSIFHALKSNGGNLSSSTHKVSHIYFNIKLLHMNVFVLH
jgi:hypothetical protein